MTSFWVWPALVAVLAIAFTLISALVWIVERKQP